MSSVRIKIYLPQDLFDELSKEAEPRMRNGFIAEAISRLLKEKKAERLEVEYREAAAQIRRVNQELEGTIADGLD